MDKAKKITKELQRLYPYFVVLYVVQLLIFLGNSTLGASTTFGVYTLITILFGGVYFAKHVARVGVWIFKKVTDISVLSYIKMIAVTLAAAVLLYFTTIDIATFCVALYAAIVCLFAISSRTTAFISLFCIGLATVFACFDPNSAISNALAIAGFELICIAGISQYVRLLLNVSHIRQYLSPYLRLFH